MNSTTLAGIAFGLVLQVSTSAHANPSPGVTIGDAIVIAEKATGGTASEAELVRSDGHEAFAIKVSKSSLAYVVAVDCFSGEVLEVSDTNPRIAVDAENRSLR